MVLRFEFQNEGLSDQDCLLFDLAMTSSRPILVYAHRSSDGAFVTYDNGSDLQFRQNGKVLKFNNPSYMREIAEQFDHFRGDNLQQLMLALKDSDRLAKKDLIGQIRTVVGPRNLAFVKDVFLLFLFNLKDRMNAVKGDVEPWFDQLGPNKPAVLKSVKEWQDWWEHVDHS